MKINWNYIKGFALLSLIVFLYGFTQQRNQARKFDQLQVVFVKDSEKFISAKEIEKIVLQNEKSIEKIPKDSLDLKVLEKHIDEHPLVKNAEVYLTVNGDVIVEVQQKKPLARVYANASFYIDEDANKMPLSKNHTARVPMVKYSGQQDLGYVRGLLKEINQDSFLKHQVVSIEVDKKKEIRFYVRGYDFETILGDSTALAEKLRKFKAFYKTAFIDKKLEQYESIKLNYKQQVVATKKV
ncbi:cell division protein FtsQ/DivIB [Mesonia sp. HuA40]|uniref:cell division protein FtsQ/DivIB n=1 Tax=Mesonia sp. HuA40 TaxID=2602761 RepID=UPI0011CAD70F|nr:hypothetical protein [Mesonia sp. HuA40]TXK73690.1 hypothetical protein FT993_05100 [Mesonia sp. HuA40]